MLHKVRHGIAFFALIEVSIRKKPSGRIAYDPTMDGKSASVGEKAPKALNHA